MRRTIAAALALILVMQASCALGDVKLLGIQVKDTPAPTTEAEKTPAPQATYPPVTQEEIEAAFAEGRILMRGMEGEDVRVVQRRLHELGYYLGSIDGIFGLGTRTAVYGFQRAHKLEKIDGKVGPQTLERMFAEDAIVKPTPTPTPTPTPSPSPTPTASPVPTPAPTATPDAAAAPFELEQMEVYAGNKAVTLMIGRDEKGEMLYPLCGVMGHIGYECLYAAGSWQLLSLDGKREIALMTDGSEGLCAQAMGSADGVLFLSDAESRVYVYGQEAYVTARLLEKIGMTVLIVAGVPVIH